MSEESKLTRQDILNRLNEYMKPSLMGGVSETDMKEIRRLEKILRFLDAANQDNVIDIKIAKVDFSDFIGLPKKRSHR